MSKTEEQIPGELGSKSDGRHGDTYILEQGQGPSEGRAIVGIIPFYRPTDADCTS